jgi:ribosomal protein S18 acetylase RimI-like enzyme
LPRTEETVKLALMDALLLEIGPARAEEAGDIARVYIESWHDAYAGSVPTALLRAMTLAGQTARWRAAIVARELVFVARHEQHGVVGMTSFGRSRDPELGPDGEVYTLYVDPSFYDCGVGRALLSGAFAELKRRGFSGCLIWAHAKNPARFFYERLGGRRAAERTVRLMGEPIPEAAFAWRKLVLKGH